MLSTELVLTVLYLPGCGAQSVERLNQNLCFKPASVHDLYVHVQEFRDAYPHLNTIEKSTWENAWNEVGQLLDIYDMQGIEVIGLDDDRYPHAIKRLPNPPKLLFAKGNLSLLNYPAIACIGTSCPSEFGKKCALRFGELLAQAKVVTISGFSLGTDSTVLTGVSENQGRAIAVLDSALHQVAPAENTFLADSLVDSGGLLLSECAPGIGPRPGHLAENFRLIAGLSRALIILEADNAAESRFTLDFEHCMHKEIACLIHPEKYRGCVQAKANQKLLQAGKVLGLENQADLQDFLNMVLGTHVNFQPTTAIRQLDLI